MESEDQLDITGRLAAWSKGDEQALRDVIPLVYDDLRLIAHRHLGRIPRATSVQSGTLVHEAFLKLTRARGIRCNNRAHFFALCSQMIRRILTDYARKQRSAKRDETRQEPLLEVFLGGRGRGVEVDALDEALNSLGEVDPRKAKVVELRFFGGLSVEETAEVLEISAETVTRDWRMAKAWLFQELKRNEQTTRTPPR